MESNFYRTYFKLEKENWWFRVRRNIIFWFLNKYKIGPEKKILDYGCGSGFLVGQMQERGLDAFGADLSEEAIRVGLSRGVKNLYMEDRLDFPDESFDVILALDVIEHIEDDYGALGRLQKLLKPGGCMIITVPAYQWMWGLQDEVAHHFRRYSMSSILKLISAQQSLTVIKKSYFNTFLFLPVALIRIISKIFNLKSRESDFDINSSFLNILLYNIFNLEAKLLRYVNFLFGVSILLIIRKYKNEK